jgi:DNA repair protein RadD
VVTRVEYSPHKSKAGNMTLRVDYWHEYQVLASEWVCLEHRDFARHKAEKWWIRRDRYIEHVKDVPKTVAEAMIFVDDLLLPYTINVRNNGRHDEVVGHDFVHEI